MSSLNSGVVSLELDQIASLFRLLSDKTRLGIMVLLWRGERNVGRLCEEMGLAQPTVSHHLGLLRTQNLIVSRREGKQVFYSLAKAVHPDGAMEFAVDQFVVSVTQTGASEESVDGSQSTFQANV